MLGGRSTTSLEGMKTRSAILCVAAGLALLILGAFGIRSLLPTAIPLIYASLMMGAVLAILGTLRLVYGPRSPHDGSGPVDFGYTGPLTDGSHDGGCGNADGGSDEGGCGDGGGGH